MGPDGFISCFDHLLPESQLRRMLILKGGPGVGKSTFMRRLHALLSEGDADTALYFCSGDPDSLDAVAAPRAGVLILDGTAPHVVDPIIPGARDSLINLGACLDEAAMRPRLPHIRACMADHAACTRRARAHLSALCALKRDGAAALAACVDASRMADMQRALIAAVMPCPREPQGAAAAVPVIADAVTPKGPLCLLTEGAQRRIIRLARHAAMDLTPVLRALSRAAQAAGYDTEEYLDPTMPGSLLHVGIPALSTLVTTGEALSAELTFDFAACVPTGSLLRRECALEQTHAAITRHTQHAVAAMAQAKQLHDELEAFYVPNMDFARWQAIFEETVAGLKETLT